MDETDNSVSQVEAAPSQRDIFGGIYLGEKTISDEYAVHKDPFHYSVYVYGEDKKKGKKNKVPVR